MASIRERRGLQGLRPPPRTSAQVLPRRALTAYAEFDSSPAGAGLESLGYRAGMSWSHPKNVADHSLDGAIGAGMEISTSGYETTAWAEVAAIIDPDRAVSSSTASF